MNRKNFLSLVSGAALAPLVPASIFARKAAAADTAPAPAAMCQFAPSVPEGPFYFDPKLVRRDITEGRPGIPLEYRLAVVDAQCRAVANARIDIWQCDSEGAYSGYDGQSTGANTAGTRWSLNTNDDGYLLGFASFAQVSNANVGNV